jgi:hypothetical protein
MKYSQSLRSFAFALLLAGTLALGGQAAALVASPGRIQGQVTNGTTNQPLANQSVELMAPRGGMQQVATAITDASGRFSFDQNEIDSSSFYLLQATYQGVDYHAPVQFDSNGAATVNLTAYESTSTAPALRIKSARIIVRAAGDKARVQEMFAVQNPLDRSYANPDGTFRFRLSPSAGQPTVAVAGLMNMPLPQTATPGRKPGEFSIDYALKPGLTVVMVAYEADYPASGLTLDDAVPLPIASADLLVIPPSLKVDSSLFQPAGADSETGSQRYVAENLKSATPLEARFSGEAAASASGEAEQAQGQVQVLPNPITRLGIPVLVCLLLVLLWAVGVRVAKEWPHWKERRHASTVQKELAAQVDAMFNSLADLDELFAARKIPEKQYWKDRLELKARLVAALKKAPSSLLESYATRDTLR